MRTIALLQRYRAQARSLQRLQWLRDRASNPSREPGGGVYLLRPGG